MRRLGKLAGFRSVITALSATKSPLLSAFIARLSRNTETASSEQSATNLGLVTTFETANVVLLSLPSTLWY